MKIKKLNSTQIYKGEFISFYNDEILIDDKIKTVREYIIYPPAVGIIPVLENEKIVMVEQFRYANNMFSLEIPAGKILDNEDLKYAAIRELEEETGFRTSPENLVKLYTYTPAISYSTEKLTIFVAKNLEKTEQDPDEDEIIKVKILSLYEILDLINENKIMDSKTVLAILMYKYSFMEKYGEV